MVHLASDVFLCCPLIPISLVDTSVDVKESKHDQLKDNQVNHVPDTSKQLKKIP